MMDYEQFGLSWDVGTRQQSGRGLVKDFCCKECGRGGEFLRITSEQATDSERKPDLFCSNCSDVAARDTKGIHWRNCTKKEYSEWGQIIGTNADERQASASAARAPLFASALPPKSKKPRVKRAAVEATGGLLSKKAPALAPAPMPRVSPVQATLAQQVEQQQHVLAGGARPSGAVAMVAHLANQALLAASAMTKALPTSRNLVSKNAAMEVDRSKRTGAEEGKEAKGRKKAPSAEATTGTLAAIAATTTAAVEMNPSTTTSSATSGRAAAATADELRRNSAEAWVRDGWCAPPP
jgi:hypothetical protein